MIFRYFSRSVSTLLKPAAALAMAAALWAAPADAITRGGEPDNGEHPAVGLLVFTVNGVPSWRCTGTLISEYVVLTAGHCTSGANGARIWFDEDVGAVATYPFPGGGAIEATAIHTHPDYDDTFFFLYDVGVVVLNAPKILDPSHYGKLPTLNELNRLKTKRGLQNTTLTAVGYGLQQIRPEIRSDRVRLKADLGLIDLTGTVGLPEGTSIGLTNNASTGGTCFGDSGGPIFLHDSRIVAAVTSFGLNGNCAGTGFGYRLDQSDDLSFVGQFLK